MSTGSSSAGSVRISFVLAPTSTWPATSPSWVITASRCVWLPSLSLAPRRVLPSTANSTGDGDALSAGFSLLALVFSARSSSQAPTAASAWEGSICVASRQFVDFEGAGGSVSAPRPQREYTTTRTSIGTSAIQPAIAVNEEFPATTAPAHRARTDGNGCCTPGLPAPSP